MLMTMKIIEIEAFSLDEAKTKAVEQGLTVVKDVTRRYTNAGSPEDVESFAKEQFEKDKMTDTTGTAYIVTKVKGSADTKERPYTYPYLTYLSTSLSYCHSVTNSVNLHNCREFLLPALYQGYRLTYMILHVFPYRTCL